MGMMDDMQDKMGDNTGGMRERYEQLKSQHEAGELDDKGREEFERLRSRFDSDKQ